MRKMRNTVGQLHSCMCCGSSKHGTVEMGHSGSRLRGVRLALGRGLGVEAWVLGEELRPGQGQEQAGL